MDPAPAISQIVSALLVDLAPRVREAFEAAAAETRERTRRETLEQALRAARRIQRSENLEEWAAAVLDAVQDFTGRAALFAVGGGWLRSVPDSGVPPLRLRLESAPAFRSAIESRDTVVALGTAGELSAPIAALLGEEPAKAYLFPIAGRGRVIAVLCAAPEAAEDAHGLELMAVLAGAAAGPWRPAAALEDQAFHLHAQRFARALAAEIRLCRSGAVQAGRAHANLYAELKDAIDAGREAYRGRFAGATPRVIDYFHAELVHTLANDDPALLGDDYPGPLA